MPLLVCLCAIIAWQFVGEITRPEFIIKLVDKHQKFQLDLSFAFGHVTMISTDLTCVIRRFSGSSQVSVIWKWTFLETISLFYTTIHILQIIIELSENSTLLCVFMLTLF